MLILRTERDFQTGKKMHGYVQADKRIMVSLMLKIGCKRMMNHITQCSFNR